MSCSGRSATSGSRLFISMRRAASCCQPRQLISVPRGARMVLCDSTVAVILRILELESTPVNKKQERAGDIVVRLKRMYPKAKCSLDFTNPLELLIATMLSAQSTDARVNIVTKSLFRKYTTAQAYASASQQEMERDVKQTGFFRNKA